MAIDRINEEMGLLLYILPTYPHSPHIYMLLCAETDKRLYILSRIYSVFWSGKSGDVG